jgi:hypothetical protein
MLHFKSTSTTDGPRDRLRYLACLFHAFDEMALAGDLTLVEYSIAFNCSNFITTMADHLLHVNEICCNLVAVVRMVSSNYLFAEDHSPY